MRVYIGDYYRGYQRGPSEFRLAHIDSARANVIFVPASYSGVQYV